MSNLSHCQTRFAQVKMWILAERLLFQRRLNEIVKYGPRLTPGKKNGQNQPKGVSWCPVPAAHSQWLHHRRAIWRWARTLDRRGKWWKGVEIEGLRRSIHASVRFIFGHFRASLRRFQGFLIPHGFFGQWRIHFADFMATCPTAFDTTAAFLHRPMVS